MKIVLGAAGFVGFHLCNALLDAGDEVLALDNFDTTLYGTELKNQRSQLLLTRGLKVQKTQGTEVDWLTLVSSQDVIFNLAATAGLLPSWEYPQKYLENNTVLVARMLEKLTALRIEPVIVQASTSSVYGEFANGNVDGPKSPNSPYGISKLAAEQLLSNYSRKIGIKVRTLRLFSVYGEHQRPDQFFSIALKRMSKNLPIEIFGDGLNTRTNVHVSDAVRAFILAQDPNLESLVISDISGSERISTLEIVKELAGLFGSTPQLKFLQGRVGDQRSTKGDLDSTFRNLGWRPEIDFKNGIKKLFNHFSDHPEFY